MSYDASAQALRCPFCGSETLTAQKEAQTLRAKIVVPFLTDVATTDATLREFLQRGFWRPKDAAAQSAVNALTQVYVPFWIFAANTFTYWTGDTSQTPVFSKSGWYPMSGEHVGEHRDLLIVASRILTPNEVHSIEPFDIDRGLPPEEMDLDNSIVEEFRVPRKYARPLARGRIESLERQACRQYLPGRARNVHVNTRISDMSSQPVLLPIWIMVYRFKDKPYRVLINGQTGAIAGEAPFAYGKLASIVVIAIVVVALVGLVGFFLAANS
jgi:hypothetical protein